MRRLVIATKNAGKVREIEDILAGLPFEVVSLAAYPDAPDVDETGTTFEENAVLKAEAYAHYTGEITLADDSGLEIDALNGAPGVYSSRFAETDLKRNQKALDLLKNIPDDDRTARFRCVIAISDPDGKTRTCSGTVEGVITHETRGENGFGYDPIFLIPHLGKTAAELSSDQKNAISHRGKALREARTLLEEL